jgi:hypothetical protein
VFMILAKSGPGAAAQCGERVFYQYISDELDEDLLLDNHSSNLGESLVHS